MPKTDAATDLSGYATVAERVSLFHAKYPNGRIITELVSNQGGVIVFKAFLYRDSSAVEPAATGWAAEREGDGDINSVACLENTETSAIGRALANLGFTASSRRPSREEMLKAQRARDRGRGGIYPLPTRAVREPAMALQLSANAAYDVLELLKDAERHAFPARRAELIRQLLTAMPPLHVTRIERIEGRLRHWLRRADNNSL